VIIPTRGRADSCQATVASVFRQNVLPDQVIVSAVEPSDWRGEADPRVRLLLGAAGLTRQRNRGIAALDPRCQVVTMLDDDVELPEDYFQNIQRLFTQHPDVALCFGAVREFPRMSRENARQVLTQWPARDEFRQGACGLGCSMNIRRTVVDKISFDERLPLYGWLEDADFAARARPYGKQGTYEAARTLHLVEPKMRLSGVRFGYAQAMNPYYLWRKGSLPLKEVVVQHWIKAIGSNLLGLVRRDPAVDRWGRLRGNARAFSLILRGRAEPELLEKL
jgi:GT2 family glycosyltransferase